MDYSPVDLVRIDPSRRMRRFYRLVISKTLWGEPCLTREWGRIGSPGTVRCEIFLDPEEAEVAALKLARAKIRKGYRQISGSAVAEPTLRSRASSAWKRSSRCRT